MNMGVARSHRRLVSKHEGGWVVELLPEVAGSLVGEVHSDIEKWEMVYRRLPEPLLLKPV